MYLTDQPIDLAAFFAAPRPSDGAVCLFVGVVRNESEGRETVAIEYQAYEEMAESEIAHVVASVSQEWPGTSVRITHRVGRLSIGEPSVAILVTAPHRDTAFAACRLAIEWLKEYVPIWKREIRPDGTGDWVEPRSPSLLSEGRSPLSDTLFNPKWRQEDPP
ncbi:MAG TPA: molybdenum cofactor biosynthesis protein MoaE [Thermoanaerobaculia bacterium]|nr:molybdenum cofactor biosynthesis protein MoaE [Thermoanaerobaculia bacterium]